MSAQPLFRNPDADLDARVDDLIVQMTLEEKIQQLVNDAPAIDRLGLPAYNYWSEALHGVARAGVATVFPQAISLAAMFDAPTMFRVATAISDEGRAKFNAAREHGAPTWYTCLNYWSPNINIFRDPRWGRGHETYGEDPYLTSRLGVQFIKGLQGDDERYLKASACAKHYAVHNGPEALRWEFDAVCSAKDLRETYLPAFKAAVQEAGVENVMGAYNELYGVPCCASEFLLQQILRDEWGFKGHVVSDCGAVRLFDENYHYTSTPEESVAAGIKAGCDLNCGAMYALAGQAIEQGLLEEADLDLALHRTLRSRFKLGLFDPQERVPWASIPLSVVDSPEHRALAREAAQKSVVLLKNNGILPLDASKIPSIMLVGPTGNRNDVLLGNYYGLNPNMVTPVEGILGAVDKGCKVHYVGGTALVGNDDAVRVNFDHSAAHDVTIAFMGLAPELEGEAGDANGSGDPDRADIALPAGQEAFLKAVKGAGKPVILVLTGGSAMAVNWAQEYVDAIVWIGYPGEEGGNALADVLFGKVSPSGRLPVTWYKSVDDLGEFVDYAIAGEGGRTYRYFRGEPLYPFGYGLSYSTFAYSDLELPASVKTGEGLQVKATVTNSGTWVSEEVAQLYLHDVEASAATPIWQLAGFQRVILAPGESKSVTFEVKAEQLQLCNDDGAFVFEPGAFSVQVGGCSPGARGVALGASEGVTGTFELV